ncbi:hypothetical protein MMC11_006564 [Xylographa trunciseda]|nr:hypothetical protein [Xylographa trunciseda]
MPTSTTSTPPLPPASSFDFIPPLHALLSRLLPLVVGGGGGPEATGSTLAAKDLATEAAAIKIQVQQARAAVAGLPDVQRTLAEQRGEIAELEARVAEQRAVLGEVAAVGRRGG